MIRLGKVRTEVVKRIARELVSSFPNAFNENYEDNKRRVAEFVEVEGKRLRNRIAGYVTRLKAIEAQRASTETEVEEEEEIEA